MKTLPACTPPQRPGTAIQTLAAVMLMLTAGGFFYLAARPTAGSSVLALLLVGLLLTVPIPFLLYGAYALRRAAYTVDRERVVLQWGWWVEEIPMQAIVWVQPAEALEAPLPLPRVRWPGNLTGERRVGHLTYTFMAAQPTGLIVIATENRWFVISPAEPERFLEIFRRAAEEGSLEPGAATSHRPTRWLRAIWHDRLARALLLVGWGGTLAGLVWSNLAAAGLLPGRFSATAVNRAVLLAAAALLAQGLNAGLGLFAYQSPRRRSLAHLIWLAGALAAAGFLASIGFVLLGGTP